MGLLDWLTGKPTKDTFAQQLMTGMRQAGDTRSMRYDRDDETIFVGEDSRINIHNMFIEHCQLSRDEREAHLQAMVRAMLPPPPLPDEFDDASHDLRPRIWARAMFAQFEPDKAPPHHSVGSHLIATLVYDLPHSVRTISDDELENWGVSYYEALEIAKEQLTRDNFVFMSLDDSVHSASTGDTYDASRLLLVDLIRRLTVSGTPVAIVPHRDKLLLTGSDDIDGLRLILKMAEEEYREAARPLCPLPLCLDDDQWVDWMPPEDHPLHRDFRDWELKVLFGDYENQKPQLEQVHGDDKFVASFLAMKKDSGDLFSYSTWSKGVPTLLPKTQYVMFVDPDENRVVAKGSWEVVHRIVGHLMRETDDYPLRYFVDDFPNEEQLAVIGNEEP